MAIFSRNPLSVGMAAPGETRADSLPSDLTLDRRESVLRVVLGWLLVVLGLSGNYGVAWDVQWHAEYGRDSFWSAPHDVIYGTITLSGLIALFTVLIQTWRYHRSSRAVTKRNTTAFLGIFHAQAGFFLLGFTGLASLFAAPLDDYWHQLYGIDVTIWAPFHSMAILSGIFARIAVILILMSELNRSRSRLRDISGQNGAASFEKILQLVILAGLALAAVSFIGSMMLMVVPSIQPQTLAFNIFGWRPGIYSTLLAFVIPLALISLVVGTGIPGMATGAAVCFSLFTWLMSTTLIGVTETSAAAEGLTKRSGLQFINLGSLVPDTQPGWVILYGILIDLAFIGMTWIWARSRFGAGSGAEGKTSERKFRFPLDFSYAGQKEDSARRSLRGWLVNPWRLAGLAVVIGVLEAFIETPYMHFVNTIQQLLASNPILASSPQVSSRLKDFVVPDLLTTLPLVIVVGAGAGFLAWLLGLIFSYELK